MTDIRVTLDRVEVLKGQGVGEGALELRIQVFEVAKGGNVLKLTYPGKNVAEKFSRRPPGRVLNRHVATYRGINGRFNKTFLLCIVEIDKGTLGQDEVGENRIRFAFDPDEGFSSRGSKITLKNRRGKDRGQVGVSLVARRI